MLIPSRSRTRRVVCNAACVTRHIPPPEDAHHG